MRRESGLRRMLVVSAIAALTAACSQPNSNVYTSTVTIIGVDVSQSASQVPTGTLGYKRAELGIVPTDLGQCRLQQDNSVQCPANISSKNAPDVLMELYYSGIFSFTGGIYQRLAIGSTAVIQPGAAALFAKSPDGKVDPAAAQVVQAAAGKQDQLTYAANRKSVEQCVSSSGNLVPAKLAAVVDAGAKNDAIDAATANVLKSATTLAELETMLKGFVGASEVLTSTIKSDPSLCK